MPGMCKKWIITRNIDGLDLFGMFEHPFSDWSGEFGHSVVGRLEALEHRLYTPRFHVPAEIQITGITVAEDRLGIHRFLNQHRFELRGDPAAKYATDETPVSYRELFCER